MPSWFSLDLWDQACRPPTHPEGSGQPSQNHLPAGCGPTPGPLRHGSALCVGALSDAGSYGAAGSMQRLPGEEGDSGYGYGRR